MSDDQLALELLFAFDGIGPAVASAILTAHDQHRYTVMDWRTLSCLRDVLRIWPEAPDTPTARCWSPYLAHCRQLAAESGLPLRVIDRALFMRGKVD